MFSNGNGTPRRKMWHLNVFFPVVASYMITMRRELRLCADLWNVFQQPSGGVICYPTTHQETFCSILDGICVPLYISLHLLVLAWL